MTAFVRRALGAALGTALACTGVGATAGTAQPVPGRGASATSSQSEPIILGPENGLSLVRKPVRLLDTRTSGGAVRANGVRQLCVTDQVPLAATGLFLNVTAVRPATGGYLSVYPTTVAGTAVTSSLNFSPGRTVANHAVVAMGASRCVLVRNQSATSTHLVLDLQGWIEGDPTKNNAWMTALTTPARAIDTRTTGRAVPAHGFVDVTVGGRAGVPSDTGAVALNLTVTRAAAAGYALAAPAGLAKRPTGTTVSFVAGRDRAALSVVRVKNGKVRLYNESSKPVHFVADVFGHVRWSSIEEPGTWVSNDPTRAYDSRAAGRALVPGEARTIELPSIPPGSSAAALSVTTTAGSRSGDLTVPGQDTTSFLNYDAGQNATNAVFAELASRKPAVTIINHSAGDVHVIVDVTGYVRPKVWVEGTVLTGDGVPLPGASVFDGFYPTDISTDAAGDFRWPLNDLVDGQVRVTPCFTGSLIGGQPDPAWSQSCDPRIVPQAAPITVPVGSLVVTWTQLERTGTLQGTMVDQVGAPAFAQYVTVRHLQDGQAYRVTNMQGSWQMQGLPVGTYVVDIRSARSDTPTKFGLAREWLDGVPELATSWPPTDSLADVLLGDPKRFTVDEGGSTDADATLEAAGVLRVTIQSSGGTLSPSAHVELTHSRHAILKSLPLEGKTSATFTLVPGDYQVCVVDGSTGSCWDGTADTNAARVAPEQMTDVTVSVP